ncbi:hypothetical protein F5Y06DRAFT_302273 [Hypoxylon sp. FL0890]|nr:hypothetical protein F5Y06DRAFT_302273 [Hypoxylon sp. FL0890]
MHEPWWDDPNAPNNGPQGNIVVWVLAILATLFLGLRVACKLRKHSQLWCDDWFLVASWVLLIISCTLVSVNIAAGLGKHEKNVNPQTFNTLGVRTVVAGALYAVSSAWSKTSFAITLLRIATPRLRIVIWFLMITMNIFMYTTAVLGFVACSPMEKQWGQAVEGECWPTEIMLPIAMFFNVYSGFMDFVLAILAWIIIIKLQINLKEKIGLAIGMGMGVLAGITTIIKALGLRVINEHDFNYFGVELIIHDVAEIATTIIAASIPVLRTLIYSLPCCCGKRNAVGAGYARSASPGEDRTANNRARTHWREAYIIAAGRFIDERSRSEMGATLEPTGYAGSDEIISYPRKCASVRVGGMEDVPVQHGDGVNCEDGLYHIEKVQMIDRSGRSWI